MGISRPHETLSQRDYTATAEIISKAFSPHPGAQGFRISIFATTAGTLEIDEFDLTDTPQPIQTAIAVLANDKVIVNFTFSSSKVRARFTPGSQPGSSRIEGMYYGHGGSVA